MNKGHNKLIRVGCDDDLIQTIVVSSLSDPKRSVNGSGIGITFSVRKLAIGSWEERTTENVECESCLVQVCSITRQAK